MRACTRMATALALTFAATVAGGGGTTVQAAGLYADAPQGAQRARVLIVSGVGGEPQYVEAFHKQGLAMVEALRNRFGVPDGDIVYLAEDPKRDATRIKGQATKANVEQAISAIVANARANDLVFLLFLGHGSGQDAAARFNLVGPDITAGELARLLKPLSTQTVAVVNAASASGDFVKVLSGPNRVIATATKSGMERNETKFGQFFVQAYTGDVADADKDGRVSLLEAFDYARREVVRAYEQSNHLQTEHAMIDDNGDGAGTTDPGRNSADGALARRVFLGTVSGSVAAATRAAASSDPRIASLEREKDALEARIDSLRRRKATMESTAYERDLERLLVDLAEKNKAIREATGRKP